MAYRIRRVSGLVVFMVVWCAAQACFPASVFGQADPWAKEPLTLRIHVDGIEQTRNDDKMVEFTMNCRLEFANLGDVPAIIYWDKFWIGGYTLAESGADAQQGNYFYDLQMWPSNYRNASWAALTERIDQPNPPADLTRTIAPGESLLYGAEVHLRFPKKDCSSCTTSASRDAAWKRIQAGDRTMWLQLAVESWPVNIEEHPGRDVLGKKLLKRWRKHGLLQLDNLVSEPVQISLPFEAVATAHRSNCR